MRFLPTTVLGAALALGGLSACGSTDGPVEATGETVEITDAQDRTVLAPLEPETVVVTDWSVIRTLADLGIEADAVPEFAADLPADLAAYAGDEVPRVGTVFEPDYEAIAAMDPDLVIVGSRSGTPEIVEEFERIAPVLDLSVRATEADALLAELRERVTQIGDIFGETAAAEALLADLDTEIADVREQATADGRTAMVVQVSEGTVAAYGPSSPRFGLTYSAFGFSPTDAPVDGEGSHGEEISQEFFVEYNPGTLFVLDRSKAIGQADTPALDVLDNDLVGATDAAKDDRIFEIDGFSWYLAPNAPSSLQQMVDDMSRAL